MSNINDDAREVNHENQTQLAVLSVGLCLFGAMLSGCGQKAEETHSEGDGHTHKEGEKHKEGDGHKHKEGEKH